MDKLLLIIKREYLAKVRNKSFIVLTVLSPLLIVGMIALVVYLAKVNSDDTRVIAVLDESPFFDYQFENSVGVNYVHFEDVKLQAALDSVNHLGFYGLLYIPPGEQI